MEGINMSTADEFHSKEFCLSVRLTVSRPTLESCVYGYHLQNFSSSEVK